MFGFIRQQRVEPELGHRQFVHFPTSSLLEDWWKGWAAFTDRMPLAEYLRPCLAEIMTAKPPAPLPVEISINEKGEIIQTPNPTWADHPWQQILDDPPSERPYDEAMVRPFRLPNQARGYSVARELNENQDEIAKLNAQIGDNEGRTASVREERERLIRKGKIRAQTPRVDSLGQRRHALPGTSKLVAMGLAIVAFNLLEAGQFAPPVWNFVGVDPTNLAVEWSRNWIGVLMGAGFAVAASGGIYALWCEVLKAQVWTYRNPVEIVRNGVIPLLLSAVLILLTWGIGVMRYDMAKDFAGVSSAVQDRIGGSYTGRWVFVLLTIIIPIAAAFLHEKVRAVSISRQKVREEQERLERQQLEPLLLEEQFQQQLQALLAENGRVQGRLEHARSKIQRMEEEAQASERTIRETIEEEHRVKEALVNSAVAVLERKRFYYLKASQKGGAVENNGRGNGACR